MSESTDAALVADEVYKKTNEYLAAYYTNAPSIEIEQKYGEAVNASVDALQYATEGNLWHGSLIEADLPPNEAILPYGSHATFFPRMGSTDQKWGFALVMTTELEKPKIGGVLQVEGSTTNQGTWTQKTSFVGTEMDQHQAIVGLTNLAYSAVRSKEQKK